MNTYALKDVCKHNLLTQLYTLQTNPFYIDNIITIVPVKFFMVVINLKYYTISAKGIQFLRKFYSVVLIVFSNIDEN